MLLDALMYYYDLPYADFYICYKIQHHMTSIANFHSFPHICCISHLDLFQFFGHQQLYSEEYRNLDLILCLSKLSALSRCFTQVLTEHDDKLKTKEKINKVHRKQINIKETPIRLSITIIMIINWLLF